MPTQRARAYAYVRQPDGFLVAAGDACCRSGFTPLFALGRYHGRPGADRLKVNLALRAKRLARVLRRRRVPVEVAAHDLKVKVRVAVRLVRRGSRKRLLIARGKFSVRAFGRRTKRLRLRRAGRRALARRRRAGKRATLLITAAGRDVLGGRGKTTIRARLR